MHWESAGAYCTRFSTDLSDSLENLLRQYRHAPRWQRPILEAMIFSMCVNYRRDVRRRVIPANPKLDALMCDYIARLRSGKPKTNS